MRTKSSLKVLERGIEPSPTTGAALPLATFTTFYMKGLIVGTYLQSLVTYLEAHESIIHILFVTRVEILNVLPSLPVVAIIADAVLATGSCCLLASATALRDLLWRKSRALSQFSRYPIST